MFTLINKIRRTESFSIPVNRVEDLAAIFAHFEPRTLVYVAFDAKAERWTARCISKVSLVDHYFIVTAWRSIEIVESKIIVDFSQVEKA